MTCIFLYEIIFLGLIYYSWFLWICQFSHHVLVNGSHVHRHNITLMNCSFLTFKHDVISKNECIVEEKRSLYYHKLFLTFSVYYHYLSFKQKCNNRSNRYYGVNELDIYFFIHNTLFCSSEYVWSLLIPFS